MNSGDWIENLTSLEYQQGEWTIYQYDENIAAEPAVIVNFNNNKKIPSLNVLTDEVGVFFNSLNIAAR
jgi:hypothetical protein